MNWKKFGLFLLYPHVAIIICITPISIAFLVFSLIFLTTDSIIAIISYLLSFYVLLTICLRVPNIIKFFNIIKRENILVNKFVTDAHFRMNISLYSSLLYNIAFAIFQLGLGFYHHSVWFYSMFAYYVTLGIIRFLLVKHTTKYKVKENILLELKKYLLCGILLLIMNLALAVIVFFVVYHNKTFYHNMITTIVLAVVTFIPFIFSIINLIKYKKYKSPAYSAVRNINFIAGCVSILTLETTMLTTFGQTSSPMFRQVIISLTGSAVVGIAITIAIVMIVNGRKNTKKRSR